MQSSADQTGMDAIERAHRRARAVALRTDGKTIRQIAEELGVAPSTVHEDISRALADVPVEEVDQLREVEGQRLDALQRGIWQSAIGGDLLAIDRVLKISAQRSKLLGLNRPEEIAVTAGSSELDLDRAVADLVASIQAGPAPSPFEEEEQ